ncbi:AT-hook motif nuclear-localized protein 17-like [Arachis stenosperma]|uniref:AT-hook motif nuclear-localized protein 17-like n=1 Tax=Arachis stenosperma TaxID=217475 RepID=UPI0025AC699A|nr:AT-hook motif nuclear-localized protein 17-like [Arachis stenosperma]
MANDDQKSILSQTPHASESESSEHHSPGSFATPPGSDSTNSATKSDANQKENKISTSEVERYILAPRAIIASDGNTLSGSKRPRGRPRGSKNKPKPPIIIRQVNDHGMRPVFIEIAEGVDIVEGLIDFAVHRRIGISILSGCGSISEAVIHNVLSSSLDIPIHGPFNLMSLSGTYFDGHVAHPPCTAFSILLAGSHGQVFGGIVGGKVLSGGTVKIMATSFERPEIHKLNLNAKGVVHHNNDTEKMKNNNNSNNLVRIFAYKEDPNMVTRCSVANPILPLKVANHCGRAGVGVGVGSAGVKNENMVIEDNHQA